MKKVYLSLLVGFLSFLTWSAIGQTTTYSYTGGVAQYTVPPCTYFLTVDVQGAQGGNSYNGYLGGKGGRIQATLAVTPGQTLQIYVGGAGPNANVTLPGNAGGWNGGGQGTAYGGSGGGASDIRVSPFALANRVVVAGGGGGGANYYSNDPGGAAGGTTGSNGTFNGSFSSSQCGGGGSQTTGGSAASGGASAGALALGGNGAHGGYFYYGFFGTYYRYYYYSGGGGGGGYYGGGGGQNGSGGGGSSFPITGAGSGIATAVTSTGGFRSGNGQILITPGCNAAGTISGLNTLCVGSSTTYSDPTAGPGPTGTWVSSNTAVGTISSAGVLTGIAAGTTTVSYNLCNTCTAVATMVVTVNPAPAAITGSSSVCVGQTTILSNTTTGGTWSSSSSAIGSVGSTTGVVTGVSAGNPVITYTLPAGCYSTFPMVVNASPAAIAGNTTSVCPGITLNLNDVTSGGTWSSSNSLIASVGSLTGVMTGVSAGNPIISYTLSSGCFATTVATVNSMSPITGSPSICLGSTSTLSDLTPGGVWSSSNSAIASVGSATGVVSGVSVGTATITYNSPSAGCFATMTVYVVNTPTPFTVIGGGSYCTGGSGVTVGLSSSNSGVVYTLFNGSSAIPGTIIGSGFTFNFPAQTAAGTYGIVANYGSPCAVTMSGTVNITINPLPTPFTVSGGGSFCAGGSGAHVYLNSSTIGVNYQLYVNTGGGPVPVGGLVPGTGASLDFGAQTVAGTYTVTAQNATTTCFNNMSGSVTITVNPLPTSFSVTPSTGGYCTGGSGVNVGLAGSVTGTNYQLMLSGSPVGSPVAGTGSAISFGLQTTPGVYTVVATVAATGCTATMSGSSTISINPLPTVYTVTGGGSYCFGGSGVTVGLNGSQLGVNYTLYNGGIIYSIQAGTGTSISFGLQTAAGSYTVVAANGTTTCTSNMFGSASVTINPLPTSFSVTGGGSYCYGGTGIHVGLSGSVVGTNYQLMNGTSVAGAASGTGAPLDFGAVLAPGNYTVIATNTTSGCQGGMLGFVTVIVNPLPTAYTVTGGGSYCSGGTGVTVGLSNSQSGVTYQLLRAGVPTGAPVTGTGSAISFGLQTAAGAYTVVATTTITGCTNTMTGSVAVIINPLPTIFNVTGGGGYCTGGSGLHVGLSGSDLGVSYQLYQGSTAYLAPINGVGSSIDFGVIAPAGTYTVQATNSTTGCVKGMSGSAVITINPLPSTFAMTMVGSGAYCAGGTGVTMGLAGSALGVNYQLMRGTTPAGLPVAGTGSAISFPPQTTAGTYTVVGTSTAGCSATMTGSETVTINPLPSVFTVSGTGSYCAGGTGLMITLSGSTVGINYQLNYLGSPIGAPQPGTGAPVLFGPVTGAGNYTVTAINTATTCTNIMAGSATITINPLPTTYLVTGGGSYCSGGTGVHVGLSGSTIGVNYQLIAGGVPTGSPLPGTSVALDFGPQTTGGSYSVLATNTTTGCSQLMTGTVTIAISPLPAAHNVTGGGNYCPGGTGVHVGLDGSNAGTSYQLMNGLSPVGGAVVGTGAAIDFGVQTATGTYTVVATNSLTGCVSNMTGSVTIGLFSLPTIYNVTGGGNFCPGGSGVHVGLSGTSIGVSYQLKRGGSSVGSPIAGTGFAIDFGLQTVAGTYTVVATNTTSGCSNNMNGNAIIGVSPLPSLHNVTGGGNYCVGGTGLHIGLDGSNTGVAYQLMNGITPVGSPMAGTGLALDFGLQTAAGTYTIVGTGTTTSCSNTMTGSATIIVNPLPTTYTITGGGNFCSGGTGVDVMLSGSDPGVTYQLFAGTSPVGTSMTGTGSAIDFGMQTTGGTYVVVATNTATSCSNTMTGTVAVSINPPPTPYNVGGGGIFCTGGTGAHVTLSGSDVGSQYQLLLGGSPIGAPMAGTGFGLDFGLQTAGGTYTVQGTNMTTSCSGLMTGSVIVGTSALPSVYNVMATGSSYCAGGAGVDVTLSGSDLGSQYQLYIGGTTVGSPVSGTGLPIDFGYQTLGGTYTVVAINTGTSCTNNMSGSATITVEPLPASFTVTGGGSYCSGGSGVNIGLSGSNVGVTYQLFSGGLPVGGIISGTGLPLSFGLQTTAGTYTVVATNTTTTCNNTMSGTVTVGINSLPTSYVVSGGGNYCAGSGGVNVGLNGSSLGTNYQLMRGTTPVGGVVAGTGFSLNFGPQTVTGTYTVVATNATTSCSATMSGSATVGINPAPATFTVIGGGNFCPGGTGVHVGLSGSGTGVSYQLFNGTAMVGTALTGTGTALDFGLQTAAGTYTVVATNGTTSCTSLMSGSASVTISSLPSVFNVVGGGNYCAGGTGVHIGLNGSTSGISYQLYNGFTPAGSPVIGTGTALDLGAQTGAGTYTVIATDNSTGCTRNMSGSATVGVNPLVTPAVTISTGVGDTSCSGQTVTFTAMPVNGGATPSYQWTVNGVVAGVGSVYAYVPLNGDVIGVTMTSNAACATPSSATNSVGMTVYNTEMPAVTVTTNPGTVVCQGTIVNFTATPNFGGPSPSYTWVKNGVNSGSSSTFSYTPSNGDVVYCVMTSDYYCRTATNVSSSHINMEVDQAVIPVVSVSAHPNGTLAPGEMVTFVATVTSGGGPSPSYQWLVNGVAIPGANGSTYTNNNFGDNDTVTCQVLSSGGCSGLMGFNTVTVHVRGVGVAVVNSAMTDIKLVPNPNNGTFSLKGTLGTNTDEDVTFEITDVIGQVVYRGKFIARNGDVNERIQMNGSVANGTYLVTVHASTGNKIFHVVIEQ